MTFLAGEDAETNDNARSKLPLRPRDGLDIIHNASEKRDEVPVCATMEIAGTGDGMNTVTKQQMSDISLNGSHHVVVKKEEIGTISLMAIPEDGTYQSRKNGEVLENANGSTISVPVQDGRIPSFNSSGVPSPLVGREQDGHGNDPSTKSEGSNTVISKKEGSTVVNLHTIPVYSPRPIQPNTSSLQDPFLASRPVRRRHDSENVFRARNLTIETDKANAGQPLISPGSRPSTGLRTLSTPNNIRSPEFPAFPDQKPATFKQRSSPRPEQLKPLPRHMNGSTSSPIAPALPLPPLSLATYLQLELSSHRPSQAHIYRSASADFPYESSRVKIERLLNFLFLPYELEGVLWFGALACLDYWLYTFTILPLRLLKSLYILATSWTYNLSSEVRYVGRFIYSGSKRMWHRRHVRSSNKTRKQISRANSESKFIEEKVSRAKAKAARHHRRVRSMPSMLLPDDKADILKGLLIIFTCLILLRLDASRMYHWVRGQATIKLYVMYNVLEVFDRLLSAIGQDVLECLFSQETLERKPDGHSKILRPFWLFILALAYTVIHSTALFYQVVTLNVAVNSYSNALTTLLMSNQFVEIKGTVFKKFEKENLFQITCADIVERFQLWHMLIIIASRNIVETGAWNIGLGKLSPPSPSAVMSAFTANITSQPSPPRTVITILPQSFTLLPSLLSWLSSYIPTLSQVVGPFIIVLGSEMIIDWLKHAYINKFNNIRPVIYSQFLDILAKDYYTNAFGDQNLTKRLGLPILPLSCLLIRAGVQTYQMFAAAWMPAPLPSASASLASIHQQYTASRSAIPTSTAAIIASKVDDILYHIPSRIANDITNSVSTSHITTILVLLLIYLMLLACKLILGMVLLAYSRKRYKSMREREKGASHHVEGGRRFGGWGGIEVDEDKRRWIYEDDPTGLRGVRDREAKEHAKREQAREKGSGMEALDKVKRYDMVAKRIW